MKFYNILLFSILFLVGCGNSAGKICQIKCEEVSFRRYFAFSDDEKKLLTWTDEDYSAYELANGQRLFYGKLIRKNKTDKEKLEYLWNSYSVLRFLYFGFIDNPLDDFSAAKNEYRIYSEIFVAAKTAFPVFFQTGDASQAELLGLVNYKSNLGFAVTKKSEGWAGTRDLYFVFKEKAIVPEIGKAPNSVLSKDGKFILTNFSYVSSRPFCDLFQLSPSVKKVNKIYHPRPHFSISDVYFDHKNELACISYYKGGRQFGQTNIINIVDLKSGNVLKSFSMHIDGFEFSPSGKYLVFSTGDKIKIFETESFLKP